MEYSIPLTVPPLLVADHRAPHGARGPTNRGARAAPKQGANARPAGTTE